VFILLEPKGIISELNLKNLILFSIEKFIALPREIKLYLIASSKLFLVTELSFKVL
jgi:hypothetical protein